ncbi:hypothetical protein L1987_48016 [Smallanthus sonchifolius]|uniref:Uncharacterized protein n=1 Tax=Smallanthus sonchifolius TaxID=185202 RepID=A0ACB9FRW7_9ASTR|nr:hypothetical protein L1987_48016 [Smallanthus sonchifolius]
MRRLSLLAMKRSSSKKRKKSKDSSSVKEICEADISTELGKGCEKTGKVIEICDRSEVREVFQRKLPTISGKALDPEFNEIEDEEKGIETDIGSEDSELKENDDSIQKQENDTAKKGKKELKKSTDGASGVGKYIYKVRRSGRLSIKALSRFTNTTDDPICLETDESVKRVEKRERIDSEWTESSDESIVKKKKLKKENELGDNLIKKRKGSEWPGLITSSSPAQFFKCIGILRGNQIEDVKRMGFGRLLKLKMDGIPAKICHFVVDSFCPKKIQIIVQKHRIKRDCATIQQLLGVPCGEVTIESTSKLKTRDDSVKAWRKRYPGNFVAPTELVSNIENAEDGDCFNFRMDFLMCFLAVMVECHGQGRCKEIFLDKLIGETDFSNINWCAYIIDSMRGCKKRWKRNDRRKYKRLNKLIEDEDEDEEDNGYSVVDEIEGLEKLLDVIHKQKKLIDNKLRRSLEKHPDREVLVIKAKYDSLMQTMEGNSESGDDENTDTEQHSEPVGGYDSSASENQEEEEETGDKDVNADIVNGEEKEDNAGMINEEEKGVGELHESDTNSLGQGDLEEGHNRQDTGVEFVEKTTGEGDKQDVEKTTGEGE